MCSEKTLDSSLRGKIRKVGGWYIKLETAFISGLPDRLILFPGGRICFAEIKTTGDKPRPLQRAIHRKLKKLGFSIYIVDRREVINQIIKEYGN